MTTTERYLVADAGNTRLKLAVYEQDQQIEMHVLEQKNEADLAGFFSGITYSQAILSSVRSEKDTAAIHELIPGALLLKEAKIPLLLNYETPDTLGADRLANAVAIAQKSTGAALAIDFGTCIKFDLVDENKCYQGGSISPGIGLRYRAMHEFTGALPLLNETSTIDLLGKSTASCMQSGVMNGIQGEIDFFIHKYEEKYPSLTIFVTGGDCKHFDYSRKKNIFADENLTLDGLFLILKANAK